MPKKRFTIRKIKLFDLVCGMELDPEEVEAASQYKNEIYYFCNRLCKEHFDANPDKYLPSLGF